LIGGDSLKRNLKNRFSRCEMLEATSLATLSASLLPSSAEFEQQQTYQVGKDPGKHEPLENFKFDIEAREGWVGEAGSAKEATVAEFSISESMVVVSMRLKPGGIRELHQRTIAAESDFVVNGESEPR
jgi:hypothetical protein